MKKLAVYFICLIPLISSAQFTWQHTDGPFGSVISFIYANDKYAFVPADDFLFRSADGISWEKLEHPVSTKMSMYGDTIVNLLMNTTLDTIFLQLSNDNGESWIVKKLPESFLLSTEIRMCSHGIYISSRSDKTLMKSTDHGDSWTNVNTPIAPYKILAFDERLYIFSGNKLWRTNQSGETWENITPDPLLLESISDLVAIDSNIIISTNRWFFASHDNGMTWDKTRKDESNSLFTLALVGEDIYAVVRADLLRSTDFGTTWDTVTTSDLVFDLGSFAGVNNTFLGTSSNKGVFRWDEAAQTMVESNNGLSKGYVYDLAAGNDKIWAACGNGVFAYDIPSATWSEKMDLPLPKYEYDYIYTNGQGWVLVSAHGGKHYISEDEGGTWDTISFSYNDFDRIVRIQMIDTVFILFYDHQMFRSLDKGQHWEYIDIFVVDEEIASINGIQYLAVTDGFYITEDNWNSWITYFPPININELHVFENRLYVIGDDNLGNEGVYTSTDGFDWTIEGNGFPGYDSFMSQQAFFFRDADAQYALLNSKGHYTLKDGTFSWSELPTSQVGNSYVSYKNLLYLGGHGVYKSVIENPYITAVHEIDNNNVEDRFTISPNPTKDNITITSDLPASTIRLIDIYTSDGQLMKTTKWNTSLTSLNVQISNFPSGLYYVMVQTENGRGVKSFMKQ